MFFYKKSTPFKGVFSPPAKLFPPVLIYSLFFQIFLIKKPNNNYEFVRKETNGCIAK
jgi:hypothetical protein